MWFNVVIGEAVVLEEDMAQKDPHVSLFRTIYLVEASSVESAWNKSLRILGRKVETKNGMLDGKKASNIILGILSIDLVIDELKSGAEVYDDRIDGQQLSLLQKTLFTDSDLQRLIAFEKEHGLPEPLRVDYGDDFDKL